MNRKMQDKINKKTKDEVSEMKNSYTNAISNLKNKKQKINKKIKREGLKMKEATLKKETDNDMRKSYVDAVADLQKKGYRIGAIWSTYIYTSEYEPGSVFRCTCEKSYEESSGKPSTKPCKSPGKHPIGLYHPAGVYNFSRSPGLLRKAWLKPHEEGKTHLPNVAIATGVNFFVIDIDNKNGKNGYSNEHLVKQITKKFKVIGRVKTPSGGEHIYCKAKGFVVKSKNLADGIEIKGYGSYVLAPPSVVNGVPYKALKPLQNVEPESNIRPTKTLDFVMTKNGLDIKERNEFPEIRYRNFEHLRNKKLKDIEENILKDRHAVRQMFNSTLDADIAIVLSLVQRGYEESEIIAYYKRYLIRKKIHVTLLSQYNDDEAEIISYLKKRVFPAVKNAEKHCKNRLLNLSQQYKIVLENRSYFIRKNGLTPTDREVLTYLCYLCFVDLRKNTFRVSLSKINENLPAVSSISVVSDSLKRLIKKGFLTRLETGEGGKRDINLRGTVYKLNNVPTEVFDEINVIFLEGDFKNEGYHMGTQLVQWYSSEYERLFHVDALTGASGHLERAFFSWITSKKGGSLISTRDVIRALGCARSTAVNLLKRLALKGFGELKTDKGKFFIRLYSTAKEYLQHKFKQVAKLLGKEGIIRQRLERIYLKRLEFELYWENLVRMANEFLPF